MEWRVKSSQEGNHPIVNAYHLHTILVPLQPCKVCAANLPFSARCSSDLTAVLLAKYCRTRCIISCVHFMILLQAPQKPQKLEARVPDRFVGQIFSRSSSGTCPATRTQASQKREKILWPSGQSVAAQPPTSHLKEQKKMERKRENKVACIAGANFPGWGGARHVAKSCGRGQARRYPAHRQPNPLLPDLHPKTKTQEKKQKRNKKSTYLLPNPELIIPPPIPPTPLQKVRGHRLWGPHCRKLQPHGWLQQDKRQRSQGNARRWLVCQQRQKQA